MKVITIVDDDSASLEVLRIILKINFPDCKVLTFNHDPNVIYSRPDIIDYLANTLNQADIIVASSLMSCISAKDLFINLNIGELKHRKGTPFIFQIGISPADVTDLEKRFPDLEILVKENADSIINAVSTALTEA